MDIKTVSDLEIVLKQNKFVIYGAGYVAVRFYKSLKVGLKDNLDCFVTTNGNEPSIEGIPVIAIETLKKKSNIWVCIAVHESIKNDIISNLKNKGFYNYVWIYPFLYELILGEPIERNVKVPLKKIWTSNSNNYAMAIRYLAIEQYLGKRDNGYRIYKRCFSLFSSEKTSEKRLQQFIRLIENWEANGYDESKCSFIMEDYTYIDGAHRIAVASYFNYGYVMCDIYPMTKNLNEIHDAGAVLSKDNAKELGLDLEIIGLLEEINQRIEEQYK